MKLGMSHDIRDFKKAFNFPDLQLHVVGFHETVLTGPPLLSTRGK